MASFTYRPESSPAIARRARQVARSRALPRAQSLNQDGIDKPRRSRLIQRRNLNEQNRSRATDLSDLQKTEAAEQRNDRGIDSAVASRIHQEEIARLGHQRVHLPR